MIISGMGVMALNAFDDQHYELCIAAGYARPVTCRALLSEMVDEHGNNGRLSDRPLQLALRAVDALVEEGDVTAEPGDRRHYRQFECGLRETLVLLIESGADPSMARGAIQRQWCDEALATIAEREKRDLDGSTVQATSTATATPAMRL